MRQTKQTKDEKILFEMYRRAFAASTPPGDFDELLETSPRDEKGAILIPYSEYECEESVMGDIVDAVLKENKVPKWRRKAFNFHFWIGCSPKSKGGDSYDFARKPIWPFSPIK